MRQTLTILFLTICITSYAQVEDVPNAPNADYATTSVQLRGLDAEETSAIETEKSAVPYLRKPKSIASNFTGYKIQILEKETPIEKNHKIFEQFGGITVEHIEGQFYYSIGEFDSIDKANDFTTKIVEGKYPLCKIVEYQNGQRKALQTAVAN